MLRILQISHWKKLVFSKQMKRFGVTYTEIIWQTQIWRRATKKSSFYLNQLEHLKNIYTCQTPNWMAHRTHSLDCFVLLTQPKCKAYLHQSKKTGSVRFTCLEKRYMKTNKSRYTETPPPIKRAAKHTNTSERDYFFSSTFCMRDVYIFSSLFCKGYG